MKKNYLLIALACILSAAVFTACKKEEGGPADNAGGFDKTAMLTGYADNVIIPGYASLQEKISELQTAADAFTTDPGDGAKYEAMKAAYTSAYEEYVRISGFNFGPAETELLDVFLNFSGGLDYSFTTAGELTGFSVDTAAIESNIAAGSYTLTQMTRSSFYSQGLGALGYLISSPARFTGTGASARIAYTKALTDRMKNLTDRVASGWVAYRTEFIANTKTNIGSPIGNIVNQLAYGMDLLKGPRIGWPFGKQSNGIVFAHKTEGYYTGISGRLARAHLSGLRDIYTGGTGKGMDDYLTALGHATLNTDVLAQFDLTIARMNEISSPFSNALTAEPASVEAVYKELQKLLTLLKTDVASATAVQITFMDNDGD